jgi:hypothetical protein
MLGKTAAANKRGCIPAVGSSEQTAVESAESAAVEQQIPEVEEGWKNWLWTQKS